jgi:hypothetical protein
LAKERVCVVAREEALDIDEEALGEEGFEAVEGLAKHDVEDHHVHHKTATVVDPVAGFVESLPSDGCSQVVGEGLDCLVEVLRYRSIEELGRSFVVDMLEEGRPEEAMAQTDLTFRWDCDHHVAKKDEL